MTNKEETYTEFQKLQLHNIDASMMQSVMYLERTRMANTRTMLAYIRSSIGLFVAGAGLLKFIGEIPWVYLTGIIFILSAPVVLVFGFWEYIAMRKRLKKHEHIEKDLLQYEDDEEIE